MGQWVTWLLKHRKSDCIMKLEANSVFAPVSILLTQSRIGICPCEKTHLTESEAV